MVVKTKLVSLLIIFIWIFLIINSVSAQSNPLTLTATKEKYFFGENIKVYVNVTNILDSPAHALIESYLIDKLRNYPPAIIPFNLELDSGESRIISIYNLKVEDEMPPGRYNVNAKFSLDGREITSRFIEFEVEGTLESFALEVKTCADVSCSQKSKVFMKGETIYLDYYTSINDALISAKLEYPDGKTKAISLPYSIKAEQIGTYYLDVSASKVGYKNVSLREMFGVIEKEAEIRTEGEVSGGEETTPLTEEQATEQTNAGNVSITPLQNASGNGGKGEDNWGVIYLAIGMIVVIVLVVALVIYRIIQKENGVR